MPLTTFSRAIALAALVSIATPTAGNGIPYVGTDAGGNLHVNSTANMKVYLNGMDIAAELDAAKLERVKTATLESMVTDLESTVTDLNATLHLVATRLSDLTATIVTLATIAPTTPANWRLAVFFEGVDGEQDAAIAFIDSSAGELTATVSGTPELYTRTHAHRLTSESGLGPTDVRAISTSSLWLRSGGSVNFAASTRFNFGTESFAIDFDFYTTSNAGTYKGIFSVGHNTNCGTRIELAIHNHWVHVYTDTCQWRNTGYSPPLNTWYRARLERSNGRLRFIVNGGVRWNVPARNDYNYDNQAQPAFRIGRHVEDFSGYLDNFIITSPLQ